jgi:hypothetical protein
MIILLLSKELRTKKICIPFQRGLPAKFKL